ncbi:MAG: DUF4982 domain-containing protein [Clostridia bacterium]|nr:DUF4982 domain-containing protein [Clostridia bacterium]
MEKNRRLICENWLFAKTEDPAAVTPGYWEEAFGRVTLPHDWQVFNPRTPDAHGSGAQGYFPREEVGVYRWHFTADKAWKGKLVRVLFDGVQRFCEVYLNGEKIASQKYGYIPFIAVLKKLNYGKDNLLAVRVDNTVGRDMVCGGGDRWYSGAGIYRNVWLMVDEKSHIRHDGLFVRATPVSIAPVGRVTESDSELLIEAENEGELAGLELEVSVTGGEGAQPVFSQRCPAESKNEICATVPKMRLWRTDAPNLYTLTAKLYKGDTELDCQSVRFGVRTAVFDGEQGFLLNGVPTKLWGVDYHHDWAPLGAAVPIELWRHRLKKARTLGINSVRTSHNPMCEEFYDLCDEMGFLVIDEYCDKWEHSGLYFDLITNEERLSDIEVMLRRDRNHPSVILWSVGNEIVGQYSEAFYSTLKLLADKVRSLDPTRGVSCALNGFVMKGFNDSSPLTVRLDAVMRYAKIVDVFMGNYMEQMYAKMREYGMRLPVIGSEVFTYYRFDPRALNTADVDWEPPYATVKQYPWVCGSFVWAGCDYLGESIGWPCRGWTGNLMDSTGEPKKRGWYAAAQMKSEPVLKLAVYDESEPWDMARGMWGFPQMRAHWDYNEPGKIKNVAVMTNCDTVKLYQNGETAHTGYLKDFKDGMIHFRICHWRGKLVAEGYMNGIKVAEDMLTSDIEPKEVRLICEDNALPADGKSVALAEVYLVDAYGRPCEMVCPEARVKLDGAGELLAIDNGDALAERDYSDSSRLPMHNGHMLIAVRAPKEPAKAVLRVKVKGFAEKKITFRFQ